MITVNTIGLDWCACGDYKSENLIAHATCRKSNGSGEWSHGIVHLLKYRILKEDGWKELGEITENMFGYGADGIVISKIEDC